MANISYQISNFMSLDEFENYVKTNIIPYLKIREVEDREHNIKYFLLVIKQGKLDELIPCHIASFKNLDLIPISDEISDYPQYYNINEMKRAMKYEWGNGVEYYVALAENERVIKDV